MTVKRYKVVEIDEEFGLQESTEGYYVTYSDYQKLVAENAALRHILDMVYQTGNANFGGTKVETPATDAAIAEIKAQGVDAFANYKKLESEKSGSTLSLEMSIAAKVFAANLRAGRKG